MLDSDDRDRHATGGAGFIVGLLTGTVLGVGLGMLLAPRSGSDLRGQLGEQAKNLGAKASERYQRASEKAAGIAERGREFVSQAREAVNRGAEEMRGVVNRGADSRDVPGSAESEIASGGGDSFER